MPDHLEAKLGKSRVVSETLTHNSPADLSGQRSYATNSHVKVDGVIGNIAVSKTVVLGSSPSRPATCCFANNPVDGFDASRVTTARGFTPMFSKRTTAHEGDTLWGHSLMVEYLLCTQKIGIRFPAAPRCLD